VANRVMLDQDYPRIDSSDRLYARALGLIPSTTQTLAKGPSQYVKGVAPKYLKRGRGCHVWDVDDNEYIDFNMAIGPVSLGYAYQRVDEAIRRQLEDGITFSQMHPLEVEVAELVRDIVPGAEMVRYSKTGADVTSAAVRLARAFTGRNKVLCCGYHGWHDWYIAATDRNRGIPAAVRDLTFTFNYNDLASVLESIDEDTACVILEPVVFEAPHGNFLRALRSACDALKVVLIFDEMWTGFRLALGGAQHYFNVTADLACFSKAVANGMPLSLLTGRREIMQYCERDVFFFTTFGGEALSLAAAKATIEELRDRDVPSQLARQGRKLKEGYNRIARELGTGYTSCAGMDCRSIVTFDAAAGDPLMMKSLLQQELIKRGVLWSGAHNLSFSHSDADVEHTLAAYRQALMILKQVIEEGRLKEALRGDPVEPVFRRTNNFNFRPRELPRAS